VDVTAIPFNAFLKIEKCPAESPCLLTLAESPSLLNHIGTIHASAQLALAEASSGEWLVRALPNLVDTAIAVVRHVEAKFKNPMNGPIFSRPVTTLDEIRQSADALAAKGRALIPVTFEVVNRDGQVGLVVTFTWFAQNREKAAEGQEARQP
jgi:hypothetical protein